MSRITEAIGVAALGIVFVVIAIIEFFVMLFGALTGIGWGDRSEYDEK